MSKARSVTTYIVQRPAGELPDHRSELKREKSPNRLCRIRSGLIKMGLLKHGKRQYFYECKRINGKAVNKLVASGAVAEYHAMASRFKRADRADRAAEARERRVDRQEQRELVKEQTRAMDLDERPLIEVAAWIKDLTGAALIDAGYRKRRGEWRRPRGATMIEKESGVDLVGFDQFLGTEPMIVLETKDGRPTVKVVEHEPDNIETRRRRVMLHFQKCSEFDSSQFPAVRRAFDAFAESSGDVAKSGRPFLAAMIEVYGGDPVSRAESALIRRFATSRGLYTEEAIRRHLIGFKAELLGENPTKIERVLVDSIGCCYLDAMESEERSAKATSGSVKMLEYLERRKERASRRLQCALKALDLVRRKAIPGVAVQVVNNIGQSCPSSVERGSHPAESIDTKSEDQAGLATSGISANDVAADVIEARVST